LEERRRAVAFLDSKVEERERIVASLQAQLQEQIRVHTRDLDRLQKEEAGLQQELQAARAIAETTSAELESLRRTKFYRVAAFYWRWLEKLKTVRAGRNLNTQP
jgi:predicted type IV restriction endonuclease